MRNQMKSLTILTLFTVFVITPLIADVVTGTYFLSGKILDNKIPLANQNIKIVFHYSYKKVSKDDIQQIPTNSNGEYKLRIDWTIPCRSSGFTDCKGISRDSCFHKHSKEWNPEFIGFVKDSKEIKIKNPYWEFFKQHHMNDTIIKQDIIF
jgi:hypothetical protein